MSKPITVIILDGFGSAPDSPSNAVARAITPNFDVAMVIGLRHFTANCRRRLFPATAPSTLGPKHIVVPANSAWNVVISCICKIQPLTKHFLPTVLAIGLGWISTLF